MLPKQSKIKVLVAPLDWGLGHATRCVPIIKLLHTKSCKVVVAAEGHQKKLLEIEFPDLEFTELPGYRIKYAKNQLFWRLITQVYKLKKAIIAEQKWLKQTAKAYAIDWVISDNRYGLWHSQIPCTFITHQLRVKLPPLLQWAEGILQQVLYKHINRFTVCWVPDFPAISTGISGAMGHPAKLPQIPVSYIGWLSRFTTAENDANLNYDCIILLSGPEPQRSLLEQKLVQQLKNNTGKIVFVRGLPGNTDVSPILLPQNITVYAHLEAKKMQQAIAQSKYLISRSGYSTVMDALILQKKCIFIPTPGQTEQEYLAKYLKEKNMALVYNQQQFTWERAMAEVQQFNFSYAAQMENKLLEMAMDDFMQAHF